MLKMLKSKIYLFVLFALGMILLQGCTRDDICAEGIPTTPLLIITFKDISNPSAAKVVSNLTVETDYEESVVVAAATTDSIAIPLRTGANDTRYRFIQGDGGPTENTDIVTFGYQLEDVYVNRACGFKTTYTSLSMLVEDSQGDNNWIENQEIIINEVIDEQQAHITIFH
jgi:hypothetical protein